MKKYYFAFVAFCFFSLANGQIINFPDSNFKAKLLAASSSNNTAKNLQGLSFKIDANNDGEIQQVEALMVSRLNVSFTNIIDLTGIEYFSALQNLNCDTNKLTSLDVTSCTNLTILNCKNNYLISLNITGLTYLQTVNCSDNYISSLNANGLVALQTLDCQSNQLTNLNVSGLTSLKDLNCKINQLSSLNLTNSIALERLECNFNAITNINVTGLSALTLFVCGVNQLTNLNLETLTALQYLNCGYNLLTSIDVSGLNSLVELYCGFNQIQNLQINGLTSLQTLNCNDNQLINLNLDNLNALTSIQCVNNQLTNLDLSRLIYLQNLNCENNLLINLNIKNGKSENVILNNNPNLNYICIDDLQIENIQNTINYLGYGLTCQINTYCSFIPGGISFNINGNNKYDFDLNGCNNADINYKNLKFRIANGASVKNIVSDNSGNYSTSVEAGTYTITPIMQNPSYFNISPTTATITFPTTSSPTIQNFCIIPNGNHQDVTVILIPLDPARPGFDANYKIIYKNKGNNAVTGSMSLSFNDISSDFISSTPIVTSQNSGSLNWDYVNLLPFETREILVTFNLNSPQEIPALNSGDNLVFEATISPINNDENSSDNIFQMTQLVVNSYDPNDKTCLEGNNIVPAKVGEYVNYMIRFENTGTFAAQNIVVKDIIDLAKFDIESLIPVKGSHDFYTRINSNKVEFIFENINLPFADATNDGYVAFKIKTKSTLVLGNSFSNSANIYFDYNFPIVTNTATTTVSNSLANQDFEFTKYFNLYPNPAKNSLNIETKNDLTISSLSIYNTLGQLVQVITSPTKTIDISELKTGSYFIKIVSDKGTSITKFVKE